MSPRSVQAPGAVVMIRPHDFSPNTQTASDNAFQRDATALDAATVARAAHDEAGRAAEVLRVAGFRTHVFEDTGTETPDSVFPNNWFSTHPAATWRSTRCSRPIAAASGAPISSRC